MSIHEYKQPKISRITFKYTYGMYSTQETCIINKDDQEVGWLKVMEC